VDPGRAAGARMVTSGAGFLATIGGAPGTHRSPRSVPGHVRAPSAASDRPVVTFGGFTLDPANATLKRGATPIAVTPKAFGVLELLVRPAGPLVTKDELLDDLWA